jgi:transitional endoplasmic reticulum ATPase
MKAGEIEAAQGRGYAKAARGMEVEGDLEAASHLYLSAAEVFIEAGRSSTDIEVRRLRYDLAETFLERGRLLKRKESKAIPIGEGDSNGGSSKETFRPLDVSDISFEQVGGMESLKEEIRKAIIHPLQRPDLYRIYGKEPGEGILLYGPPGCGKTFIAKATAGETSTRFFNIRISDVLNKWVGKSEQNMREVFETAWSYSPAIVFFDEIDGLGGRRSGSRSTYAKRLVNEFLMAMDGVVSGNGMLLVLAATNEPWSIDPALLRPGRFSKVIFVPPPDLKARVEIFQLGLANRKVDENIDLDALAMMTNLYSCADIRQICEEAAEIPLEEALNGGDARPICAKDMVEVIDRRPSSLIPWFRMAKKQIKNSGDADLYRDLIEIIEEAGE